MLVFPFRSYSTLLQESSAKLIKRGIFLDFFWLIISGVVITGEKLIAPVKESMRIWDTASSPVSTSSDNLLPESLTPVIILSSVSRTQSCEYLLIKHVLF